MSVVSGIFCLALRGRKSAKGDCIVKAYASMAEVGGNRKKRKSDEAELADRKDSASADLSVKEHLNNVCKEVVDAVQQHAELLAGKLRAEFESVSTICDVPLPSPHKP